MFGWFDHIKYVVPSECIHTSWLLSHFVVLQPEFEMDLIYIFLSPINTKYPIMAKWKHIFRKFYKSVKNEILTYLASISIQPPESIFCRSAFGNHYSFESSWVCLYKLCTSGFGDFLPFFLAYFLKLSQVGWGVSVNGNPQAFSQILNGIQVWALAGPLMDFHVLVLKPF